MLNGKLVVGYVGSLLHYEGLNLLMEAVALLPQLLRNNLAILIVGDGAVRSQLEHQVGDLGLSHMVQFTGKVPMEAVNDYYSLIDIAPFPRISAEVCEMISPPQAFGGDGDGVGGVGKQCPCHCRTRDCQQKRVVVRKRKRPRPCG